MSVQRQRPEDKCIFCRKVGYTCDRVQPKCGKCQQYRRRCFYDEAEASKPWGQPLEEKCLPCQKWGDKCDNATPRCGACTKGQRICLRDGEEEQDTKKKGDIRQAFEDSQARLAALPHKSMNNLSYEKLEPIARQQQRTIYNAVVVKSALGREKFVLLGTGQQFLTSLIVKKGQLGYVLGGILKDTQGRNWRMFADTTIGVTGFVLDEHLKIGIEARGWVTVVDPGTQELHRPLSDVAPGLQKTVRTLWSVIVAEESKFLTLGGSPEVMSDLRDLGAEAEAALLRGMPVPFRQVIDNGDFTFRQVFDLPKNPELDALKHADPRSVIYLIGFDKIDPAILSQHDDRFYDGAFYGGKTENLGMRRNDHWVELKGPSPRGQLYTIGSRTRRRRILIVTDLSEAGGNNVRRKKIMRILEQTVVCLFKTTTPLLLKHSRALGPIVNRYFDNVGAQFFWKVSQMVFQVTNWKPSISLGLNWKSPMLEHLQGHTSWTRQDVPLNDKITIRVYRRGELKVSDYMDETPILCVLNGGGNGAGRVWVVIPKESGIQIGARVFPVVEIAVGGYHPNAWACAPVPGPWSDWEVLNRVAIRIEWQDTSGKWFTRWLHKHNFFQKLGWSVQHIAQAGPGYNHVNSAYVSAIAVYNALMQADYPRDAKIGPWVKRGPKISVKVFDYNHLTSTVNVSNQVPEGVIPVPRLRTFIENEFAIDKAYNSASDVVVGEPPCDMCRKLSSYSNAPLAPI